MSSLMKRLRALEVATRPEHPDLTRALAERWEQLPAHVKQPNQMLGRRSAGCEGTHGVFPKCNLACTPCYHAKEANRVRTDGDHTESEVDAQMALLRKHRGPGQHAQLIGGEVSLLGPDDHARALKAMTRHGRKPMSMTHGDFDYDYLVGLAIDPKTGERRFDHLAFAGHFDSMMYGRRGIKRVENEADLNPYRQRFCEMFQRLEREHGVTHYLAHNITVTPRNVEQIPQLVRDCRQMGFRMFSFQPAAFIGNQARWKDSYREFSTDEVWKRIEEGVGAHLHYKAEQMGDVRCNRTAHGVYVGDRYETLLDEHDPRDMQALEDALKAFGGMDFEDGSRRLRAVRCARAIARHPPVLRSGLPWVVRMLRRLGGPLAIRREKPMPVTFVMHSFMDAKHVRPAWEMLQRGEMSEDPAILEAQERLQSCSYAMAHPESDTLVPACAQHSVLDPLENLRLQELLPAHSKAEHTPA